MIPAKYGHFLFSFLLSGKMSLLVAFIATVKTLGFPEGFIGLWLSSWVSSWVIAFPAVLIIAPIVRRIVGKVTYEPIEA